MDVFYNKQLKLQRVPLFCSLTSAFVNSRSISFLYKQKLFLYTLFAGIDDKELVEEEGERGLPFELVKEDPDFIP